MCFSRLGYGQVTVSTNTTWSSANLPPSGYEQGIILNGGAELTIEGLNLIFMPNAVIRIERSNASPTTLTVNSCNLEMGQDASIVLNSHCDARIQLSQCNFTSMPGATWKGIVMEGGNCGVHGVDNQYQENPKIGNDGNCTKEDWAGKVFAGISRIDAEGCTFENAHVAINVDGLYGIYDGGGIARVRDCVFLNCEKGVRISGWSPLRNTDAISASFIMSCEFNWDDNLLFGKTDLKHVVMEEHPTIRLGGCYFYNDITTPHPINERGIGIYATNADFSLSMDGDKCCQEGAECPDNCFDGPRTSRQNQFKSLGYGIKCEKISDKEYHISVRYSDFANCIHSVHVKNCKDVQLGHNKFTIRKNDVDSKYPAGYSTNSTIKQVYFKNSSGIRIHDNLFDHNLETITGIVMEDPDQTLTSFIRKNTFTYPTRVQPVCGPEMKAIELYGNNDHLDVTCNTFTNHVYDVYIHDFASLNDIPDRSVHTGQYKFNNNTWSVLPTNSATLPPLGKWMTQGCASNVFLDNQASNIIIYDRHFGTSSGLNMKFEVNAYPKVSNTPHVPTPGMNYNKDYPPIHCSALIPTNADCVDCSTDCDKLEVRETGTLGVEHLNWQHSPIFSFYPNPTNGVITLRVDSKYYSQSTVISILDIMGEEILSKSILNQEENIDLGGMGLTDGFYFIKVHSKEYSSTAKLMYQTK